MSDQANKTGNPPAGTTEKATTHRIPKEGCVFSIIRIAGLLLKIAGFLLLAIALIGFVIVLVRIGPTLVEMIPHLDHQMAGFVFILYLTNLLIFPVVGLVGAVLVGVGFLLSYYGTKPVGETIEN
jgi:hypothetical protein